MALKYLSLKEIEDAVIDPNFGKNIVINTDYNSNPYSYSYPYEYTGPSSHPHPYLGECPSQDHNYNLKPPVYSISKTPVRAISIPPLETLTNTVTTSTFLADTSYAYPYTYPYTYPYAYAAHFDAAHFDAPHFDAARFDAARFDAARFDAARFDAARFDAARFDAAHFNNVNADILAATAISERLKAKSDAFEYLSKLANKDVAY